MKAAVYREHNEDPRKVVNIEDIEIPSIKFNQVLIKVEAASYNYNDLWGIWGTPIKIPLPHISGSDVSGTVIDIGENVGVLLNVDSETCSGIAFMNSDFGMLPLDQFISLIESVQLK